MQPPEIQAKSLLFFLSFFFFNLKLFLLGDMQNDLVVVDLRRPFVRLVPLNCQLSVVHTDLHLHMLYQEKAIIFTPFKSPKPSPSWNTR